MKSVETACISVIKMYRNNNSEMAKEAEGSIKNLQKHLDDGFRIICCSSTTFNEAVVVDYVLEKPIMHTAGDCVEAALNSLGVGK